MRHQSLCVVFFFWIALVAVAHAAVNPSKININFPNLFPYGLEYSASTGFLVGSLTTGTVYKVSDTGVLTPFVQDPALQSILGIQIDIQRNALWIVNSNITFVRGSAPIYSQVSELVKADLSTGAVIARVNLSTIRRNGYTDCYQRMLLMISKEIYTLSILSKV